MNPTWANFFSVAAGASATLAGLVAVALSVNLNRILASPHLPPRAGATLSALVLILVCSMAELIPQGDRPLGVEILLFTLLVAGPHVRSTRFTFRARLEQHRPRWESVLHAWLNLLQMLPLFVGSALLMERRSGGLDWVAAGFIAVFMVSVFNSWVLLVEIMR